MSVVTLLDEVWTECFSTLGTKDLKNVSLASSRFKQLTQNLKWNDPWPSRNLLTCEASELLHLPIRRIRLSRWLRRDDYTPVTSDSDDDNYDSDDGHRFKPPEPSFRFNPKHHLVRILNAVPSITELIVDARSQTTGLCSCMSFASSLRLSLQYT